jgi:G2/mitotic-specific cyclin-B, other
MDRKYHDDVMHVPDLVQEIFEKLRETEVNHLCDPAYMGRQTEINEKMRAILVDWLVDVHLKFKLFPETFYLTVNIVDRYLSQKSIARRKLQLLGITCMLIASKYEEIYPPELRDFIYISARAYTRSEILHMERQVLNVISYRLTIATPFTFMDRFFEAGALSTKERHLAMFFVDAALQSYKLLKYKPSVLVAGAVYLSRMYSQGQTHPWTSDLQHYTQYDKEAVLPCARDIHEATVHLQSGKLKAVRQKYAKSGYSDVAAFALAKSSTISAF